MKRFVCFIIAASLLLCSGCKRLLGSDSSAYENYSDINDIVSEYEAYIEQELESGNITVSEETSVYESTAQSSSQEATASEQTESTPAQAITPTNPTVGQTTIVIDQSIKKEDAVKIEEADVNTEGSKPLTYTSLTNGQQKIYRILLTAVTKRSTEIIPLGGVATADTEQRHTDIVVAFRALSADHPEIFWMPQGYASSAEGSVITFVTDDFDYYTVTQAQLDTMKTQLDAVVQKVTAEASKLSSRFEKEVYLHDYLCENVVYDYTFSSGNMAYTAYGALVNGVAVCEGYSRAMQLLCDEIGIPCALVYGNSKGYDHMWNVIDPGDGWYHLDVTWDDTVISNNNYTRYAYFNLTEKQIQLEHTLADIVEQGRNYASLDSFNLKTYSCVSESYNYFIKKGYVFGDDLKAVADIITAKSNEGYKYAEFLYKNSGDMASVISQLNQNKYLRGIRITSYSSAADSVLLIW